MWHLSAVLPPSRFAVFLSGMLFFVFILIFGRTFPDGDWPSGLHALDVGLIAFELFVGVWTVSCLLCDA